MPAEWVFQDEGYSGAILVRPGLEARGIWRPRARSHVLQGVEIYKGKPIMYCLGNCATDWIRMRPNKEGMMARVVVRDRHVARLSLVPMTRDDENNVTMLDPASPEGSKLREKVKSLSGSLALDVTGREMILFKEP